MAAAKAWGLLPSQWLALDPSERSLIAAHEANQDRCPGCGTTLGLPPDEIEGYEHHTLVCEVCRQTHQHRKKNKQRDKERPWVYRFVIPRFRRNRQED